VDITDRRSGGITGGTEIRDGTNHCVELELFVIRVSEFGVTTEGEEKE
jgi:hypothetical protein